MRTWVLAVLLSAPVVIFATGGSLPDEVGSHFDADGRVDGSMSRETYLLLMSALTSGTPGLTWWLQCRAARSGRVQLPHRDHWMSAAHKAATVAFLERHASAMALALAIFLMGVHLLVVRAHGTAGIVPRLAMGAFSAWLLLFIGFAIAWAGWMWRRFSIGKA